MVGHRPLEARIGVQIPVPQFIIFRGKKMKKYYYLIFVLVIFSAAFLIGCGSNATGGGGGGGIVIGKTIYISTTGSDETGTGTSESPYQTIQHGLDKALANDIVSVDAGTYTESLTWPNKDNITLYGISRETTILHGGATSRCVNISGVAKAKNATISNMTIEHGYTPDNGAGIYFDNVNATLHLYDVMMLSNISSKGGAVYMNAASIIEAVRCTINNNNGINDGGGIDVNYGTLKLSNCTISQNNASYGGGLCIENTGTIILTSCEVSQNGNGNGGGIYFGNYLTISTIEAIRSRIINNTAAGTGGGINTTGPLYLSSCEVSGNTGTTRYGGILGKGGEMVNCLICNNTDGDTAGGIRCGDSSPMYITNCTITSNESSTGTGGIFSVGSIAIKNCIVWGNNTVSPVATSEISLTGVSVSYSDVRGGFGSGTGNINIDPQFVSISDFHLTPSTTTDVTQGGTMEGAPSCDFDGKARPSPLHSVPPGNCSMGAYEQD